MEVSGMSGVICILYIRWNSEVRKLDNRNKMEKNKEWVIFPVAPSISEMNGAYLKFIEK